MRSIIYVPVTQVKDARNLYVLHLDQVDFSRDGAFSVDSSSRTTTSETRTSKALGYDWSCVPDDDKQRKYGDHKVQDDS